MLTKFTKVILFISSYSPLLIIFTLKNWNDHGSWSLIPAFLAFISIIGLFLTLHFINTTSPRELNVARVQQKDAEVMAYIVTYLFPFIGVDLNDFMNLLSISIFFVIIGIIYVNSNMIHINPVLTVFGYHIYEIETKNESNYTLISRRRIMKNEMLNVVVIGDYILMERRK